MHMDNDHLSKIKELSMNTNSILNIGLKRYSIENWSMDYRKFCPPSKRVRMMSHKNIQTVRQRV